MFGGYYSQIDPTPVPTGGDDGYPRMAAARIGARDWHQEPETSAIAACHFAVINSQPLRGPSFIQVAEDTLTNVHAINPDCTIYDYTNIQETSFGGINSGKYLNETGPPGAINNDGSPTQNNNWLAVDQDGEYTGTGTFNGNPANLVHTNITRHVTPDAFGRRLPQWYAEDIVQPSFLDPHNSAGTRMHIYCDVFDYRVRENGQDLNGDGQSDNGRNSGENAGRLDWREGHKFYVQNLRANNPDLRFIANNTTWCAESSSLDPDDWGPGGGINWVHYEDTCDGGWDEGKTQQVGRFPLSGVYSDGTINAGFGNWRLSQNNYLYLMRWCNQHPDSGGVHVMNQYDWELINVNSLNPIVGTDITSAAMAVGRWGLCSTLLDDGYFAITEDDGRKFNTTAHLDEEGVVNTGTTGLSREWLGDPVDTGMLAQMLASPGTSTVWSGTDSNGIFRREFDNGLVLVNSSRTTNITIPVAVGAGAEELESGTWEIFPGAQDPAHNTGEVVNTTNFPSGLTVNRIDGYVLRRV